MAKTEIVDTRSVTAGERTFTADISGPPDGDLVLLLHGFPQTRHAWRAEMRSLAAAGFRACAPDQRGYLATLGDRDALDAAVNWYRAAGRSGLRTPDIPAVTVPTLYVWGDADQTVGRAAAEGTRGFVEGPYDFVAVPGVGHFVTDEAPEVFPPLLDAHLRAFPED